MDKKYENIAGEIRAHLTNIVSLECERIYNRKEDYKHLGGCVIQTTIKRNFYSPALIAPLSLTIVINVDGGIGYFRLDYGRYTLSKEVLQKNKPSGISNILSSIMELDSKLQELLSSKIDTVTEEQIKFGPFKGKRNNKKPNQVTNVTGSADSSVLASKHNELYVQIDETPEEKVTALSEAFKAAQTITK